MKPMLPGNTRCVTRCATRLLLPLIILMLCRLEASAAPRVMVYPFPETLPASAAYRVMAAGQKIFVHQAEVADFATFAITGPVEVAVECNEAVSGAVVRPRSRKITPRCEGKTVRFTVDAPGPLTVEINGKIRPALHLFIDPPETDAPAPGAKGVKRLAGGKIHDAGEMTLHDGETLYLEPGAVVRGTVRAREAHHIRIMGRGILDARERTTKAQFVRLDDCNGIEMRDVIVLGSYGWTLVPTHCRDLRLTNVKVFSWRDNDDGLDICASRDVVVDRCFFRTKDDCIAIKSPKEDHSGACDVERVRVQNSVFWNAEWGNAMEIGFELRTPGVRDVAWRNCDIIRVEKGAVFSIHNGDFARVENVLFEDMRVEDARDKLVDLRVGLSIYSAACPERYHRRNARRKPTGDGPWVPLKLLNEKERALAEKSRGAIRNVRFSNIRLLEQVPPKSAIVNSGGTIEDVVFQGIGQGERRIGRPEDLNLTVSGSAGVRFTR